MTIGFRFCAALCVCLIALVGVEQSSAQDMMRRDDMRRDDMHRGGGGMRGIGTGIGIGIGIGQAIIQQPVAQPTAEPVVRRASKKKPQRAKRDEPKLAFEGKPEKIAHNPRHPDGETGQLTDHKSVLVLRDGNYFRRGYYSASNGDDKKWYWYEVAMPKDDYAIPRLSYVASCGQDSDACTIVAREPTIIGFSFVDWWNGYKPVKAIERCDPVSRPDPTSKIGDVIVSCTNAAGSCSGSCELFDGAGGSQGESPPATMKAARAGGAAAAGISCSCKR